MEYGSGGGEGGNVEPALLKNSVESGSRTRSDVFSQNRNQQNTNNNLNQNINNNNYVGGSVFNKNNSFDNTNYCDLPVQQQGYLPQQFNNIQQVSADWNFFKKTHKKKKPRRTVQQKSRKISNSSYVNLLCS